MGFKEILAKYRQLAFSERDKGERFERLMQAYLRTDPIYENKFKHVWMWEEFPGRKDFGGKDTGIDLVAQTHQGDYWAIQCKFFAEGSTIDKKSVDSFLATSGRSFLNDDLQTVGFSQRLWISTTRGGWGVNAEEAIRNQNPPFSRLSLFDLEQSPVDWKKLDEGIYGQVARVAKKTVMAHQREALEATQAHFQEHDRGKLIMACGTGKTFTSLRIAENETDGKGLILFMVPSIALLGQTLRAWTADANEPINAICICSDARITKANDDTTDFSIVDLALPASTDVNNILNQFRQIRAEDKAGLTVVFSTYQSVQVIADAQKLLLQEDPSAVFDLIVCDEAHRTTGVTLKGQEESAFVKIHDDSTIRAKKRLYMTATPRMYDDNSKSKADQAEAFLWSMDNPLQYGDEIYRIGFGKAVEQKLLTDYKVLILTLSENDVNAAVQKSIASNSGEIETDDTLKLIGCINALSKKIIGDRGVIQENDPQPMKRAVAFCSNIKVSKKITTAFNTTSEVYLGELPDEQSARMVSANSKHIDGSMNAPQRDELLGWLKDENMPEDECRILTNVKCLSEGVDVPSLDAVMFLSARNSQVDVVQSVGRVMRKAPGKEFGYIIIPIVIPADVDPVKALDDNDRFKVVWTVLNALRAHDDRFNAEVNKIDLNKKKGDRTIVGGITHGEEGAAGTDSDDNELGTQLKIRFEELQSAVFAKMVQKVGDRLYWEDWARNIASIAERQTERINHLIDSDPSQSKAFGNFLKGLQKNINPSISRQEAVEMLSQHIITKPVFEALFDGYSFVKNNPISVSMQTMLDQLQSQMNDKDFETLEGFYQDVKHRAEGIDNAEGKQRIIIELYDKFFKTGFPKMVEKLGIVYTPVEVVDFIIHSVDDVLKKEFNRSLTDENVHIMDPFTGTGTFITRLIQSGLIKPEDLPRKYKHEIHANEIVLLAYYIAAVNIENAYHDAAQQEDYESFEGICLTDTFQLGEDQTDKLFSDMFPQNSARVERQKKAPIRVIFGNPPYSIGQKSANDNAQNQSYPDLDRRIAETYAKQSSAGLNKSLYDAYIKAFRWSTNRLDPENGGVICFVSNGAWLDGNSTDGFRKVIEKEFTRIYVFNLRGNQRTSGELSRKEGGKIFGSGSRTPIAITLLVKNPNVTSDKATVQYYDIGDYLTREEKLSIVKSFKTISNPEMPWKTLQPNEHGDWISMRNDAFEMYSSMAPEKKFDNSSKSFFTTYAIGLVTNRDAWVYSYSKQKLSNTLVTMISFYNEQVGLLLQKRKSNSAAQIDEIISVDPNKISWTVNLKKDALKATELSFQQEKIICANYRPYVKQNLYFDTHLIERPGLSSRLFPFNKGENLLIIVTGVGASKEFSSLMSSIITNLDSIEKAQCFPLYYFEERQKQTPSLFDEQGESEYIRRDGVSDYILNKAIKQYGNRVTKEDIFYYVYGFLHSPEYRETFANDLKKMLPRLPLVDSPSDFWKFSNAGRQLAELHLNYETQPKLNEVSLMTAIGEEPNYKVTKMRFPAKGEKRTIIYNSNIMVQNIPLKAYEYVVNGKSAIEWIMERYRITTHKDSGITNDPNDWATEVGNPRYILDLLLSIITVSVKTVDIVNELPKLKFE